MEIEKLIERLQNWDGIKPDREIDCAIEGLKALQAENDRLKEEVQVMRWIPVEEKLPEENVTVLAFNADPHAEKYVLARYCAVARLGSCWYQFDQEYDSWCASCWKVTHWMPLPPPPKEEDHVSRRERRKARR